MGTIANTCLDVIDIYRRKHPNGSLADIIDIYRREHPNGSAADVKKAVMLQISALYDDTAMGHLTPFA